MVIVSWKRRSQELDNNLNNTAGLILINIGFNNTNVKETWLLNMLVNATPFNTVIEFLIARSLSEATHLQFCYLYYNL